MIEFEIKGQTYRADKLDAFGQLHVSRKIGPVLPKLFPALALLQAGGKEAFNDLATVGAILAPLADAFATMPKDDVDLVVLACLGVVRRKQGNAWSPVLGDGRIMFADIDLSVLVPLVAKVTQDSLGDFIRGFLSSSTETEPPAAG